MTPPQSFPARPALSLIIAVFGGIVVGGAAIWADLAPYDQSLWYGLLNLFSTGAGWVLVACLVGWVSPTMARAISSGLIAMIVGMAVYYGAIAVLHIRPGTDGRDLLRVALLWLVAGLATGLIVAPAAFLYRRGTPTQGAVTAGFIAGLTFSEPVMVAMQFPENLSISDHGVFAIVQWAAIALAIVLAILALAKHQTMVALVSVGAGIGAGLIMWFLASSVIA
ncbi:MAG: DUF6518 family protein [Arcanobacterium sp.]|nr:DUF6518 family protein [Arcanobacterium sp.]